MNKRNRVIQLSVFIFFIVLMSWTFSPVITQLFFALTIPSTVLTSLSYSSITIVAFISAALLILVTFFMGRIFCSRICPLGALSDFIDTITEFRPRAVKLNRVKYFILILGIFLAPGGLFLFWVLDPINIAASIADLFSPEISAPFRALFATGLFIALAMLLGRRGFCRILCPLGAFLALIVKISPNNRFVKNLCTECGECVAACPMHSMASTPQHFNKMECIHCHTCIEVCPEQRIVFDYTLRKHFSYDPVKIRINRYHLLSLATAIGAFVTPLVLLSKDKGKKLIRPPGTVKEEILAGLCIRCGSCIKICPTRTLVPAETSDGIELFQTPLMVPRLGGCSYSCNSCGSICPTGAIKPLPINEKRRTKIGTASIAESHCLPYGRSMQCLSCHAACPFEAITLKETKITTAWGDKLLVPVVDTEKCTGCGLCEGACILQDTAAITIIPA